MLTATAAYEGGAAWVDALCRYLAGNAALFTAGIAAIPGVRPMPLDATYLAWVDFAGTGMDPVEFTARVERDARVAPSHGTAFGNGGESFLRFNLATPRARVAEAVRAAADGFRRPAVAERRARRRGLLGMAGTIRIGISGWTYRAWRGRFYPEGPAAEARARLCRRAVRHDRDQRHLLRRCSAPRASPPGRDATPDDFVFAVKGSRYITHFLRLKEVEAPLANFLASGLLRLGPKLGPILWQFPPRMRFDPDRLDAFLSLLPGDTAAAQALARRHDHRLAGRAWLAIDRRRPLRHAVEIRHDSFRDPAFIALLRRHKVALVCADTVDWPLLMDITADFVYVRLHGSQELYASGYDDEALDAWAARVAAWAEGGEPADADPCRRCRPARAVPGATSTSTSTTTPRFGPRSMRCTSPRGSVSPASRPKPRGPCDRTAPSGL